MGEFIFDNIGVVFFLSLALMITILAFLIMRKLNLKRFLISIVLSAALVFFVSETIGSLHFNNGLDPWQPDSLIPFKHFFGHEEYVSFLCFLAIYSRLFAVNFAFAVLWGALSPALFKIDTLKKYIIISLCSILPLQILAMVLNYNRISDVGFDTGSYIMAALGLFLGWLLHKTPIFKKIQKSEDKTLDKN